MKYSNVLYAQDVLIAIPVIVHPALVDIILHKLRPPIPQIIKLSRQRQEPATNQ